MTSTETRETARPAGRRLLGPFAAVAIILGFFIAGLGWIAAFPMGASPDEDYHMGSIWCPRPVSESCETKMVGGVEQILVPQAVAKAGSVECHAGHAERSAACTLGLSDDVKEYSLRYDDGGYPRGYYRFQHMFVGHDVGTSVLVMRAVNLAIALSLFTALFFVMPHRYRQHYFYAMLISWVPMGWYFINTLNPSSWAVTGTFVYGVGLFSSLRGEGRRRWIALAIASIGALMCVCSRGDAAFYLFVDSIGIFFAVSWRNWHLVHKIFAAAWSVIGVYFMASGGQAGTVAGTESAASGSILKVALKAVLAFPEFAAGLFGRLRGPGWADAAIDGPATILAMVVAGGALMVILRGGTWRKWMCALMFVGAIFGIPFLTTLIGVQPDLFLYQPRYMLPLLAVLVFLMFAADDDAPEVFTRPQKVFILGAEIVVFALALKRVMWRYIFGIDDPEPLLNLDRNNEWWWHTSITPTMVWAAATVGFLVAAVLVAVRVRTSALAVKKPVGASSQEAAKGRGRHSLAEASVAVQTFSPTEEKVASEEQNDAPQVDAAAPPSVENPSSTV